MEQKWNFCLTRHHQDLNASPGTRTKSLWKCTSEYPNNKYLNHTKLKLLTTKEDHHWYLKTKLHNEWQRVWLNSGQPLLHKPLYHITWNPCNLSFRHVLFHEKSHFLILAESRVSSANGRLKNRNIGIGNAKK